MEGKLVGPPDTEVSGVSDLKEIKSGTLVFVFDRKNLEIAEKSPAAALVTSFEEVGASKPAVVVKKPRLAQAKILQLFQPHEKLTDEREKAYIHTTAVMGSNVVVSPFCYLGQDVEIGDGTTLYPGVYVGPHSKIGKNCKFLPGVVIREGSVLGDRVTLEGGVVIGGDGFGYQKEGEKNMKVPQIGNVVIGDDVEVGANSTIDRATLGSTVIGKGTKIDNMVHIAHNCRIGENCIVVAGTGISGSVEIGDRVTLAGQVGTVGHIQIGSDSLVLARSGITKDVPSGSQISGFPARSHRQELKIQALIEKLPELADRIKQLEERLSEDKV